MYLQHARKNSRLGNRVKHNRGCLNLPEKEDGLVSKGVNVECNERPKANSARSSRSPEAL